MSQRHVGQLYLDPRWSLQRTHFTSKPSFVDVVQEAHSAFILTTCDLSYSNSLGINGCRILIHKSINHSSSNNIQMETWWLVNFQLSKLVLCSLCSVCGVLLVSIKLFLGDPAYVLLGLRWKMYNCDLIVAVGALQQYCDLGLGQTTGKSFLCTSR